MELGFPPLSGGPVCGLNDAGIETFEGDFATNVVRECTQNSLDAAANPDVPVEIEISWRSLSQEELPFLSDLRDVFEACEQYWRSSNKASHFFKHALKLSRADSIDAICISDKNTTGVEGGDDEIDSQWFGLVKSRGVSNKKGSTSGGAFGIGKDAPLAGSAFRTVLYSTKSLDGEAAFQGVCRLVTHIGKNGKRTQGTGFIGNIDYEESEFTAIRNPLEIPNLFTRREPGLDLWILGSRQGKEGWQKPFIRSALANFWPAISDNKLRFEIGGQEINSSNLNHWMEKEKHHGDVAKAYPFYQSATDPEARIFSATLPNAGESRLHLLFNRQDLPRQVCLVRKTGMVIQYYSPRIGFVPFAGLYVCDDVRGNELLRSLEPPRHDEWDPSRAEEPTAKRALDELKRWIRETIKGEIPHSNADQFNETGVPPELLETPDDPLPDESDTKAESDLGGIAKSPVSIRPVPVRVRTIRTKTDGGGGEENGDDEVEDPGKVRGKKRPSRRRHNPASPLGNSTMPKSPQISTRAYIRTRDGETQEYEIIIRSNGPHNGDIWIDAVGDDGASEHLALESVRTQNGDSLEIEGNKIKAISLSEDQPLVIRTVLRTPGKYALKASLT